MRNMRDQSGCLKAEERSLSGRGEAGEAVNRQSEFARQFMGAAYGKGVWLEVTLNYLSRNNACGRVLALCRNPAYVRLSGELLLLGEKRI